MFTGVVENITKIKRHANERGVANIFIEKPKEWSLDIGQSISVSGVCLTVVSFDDMCFEVELMWETLNKTTFGRNIPEFVNLERAMLPTDRFEGHIVQGHIDTIGEVVSTDGYEVSVSFDEKYSNLIVEKGSVTIDGVSLTVVEIKDNNFSVALISHTKETTTLGSVKKGDIVNLEFDIIGKYIMKQKK